MGLLGWILGLNDYDDNKEAEKKIYELTESEKNQMRRYTREYADILDRNAEEEISRAKDGWSLWKPSFKEYPKSPVEGLDMSVILKGIEVEPPYGKDFYSDMHKECKKILKANYKYDIVRCNRNSLEVTVRKYEEMLDEDENTY